MRKKLKEKDKQLMSQEEKAEEEAVKAAKERPRSGSRGSIGAIGGKEPISWRMEKQVRKHGNLIFLTFKKEKEYLCLIS